MNGQQISTFKYIESKDYMHTFEIWESPYFFYYKRYYLNTLYIYLLNLVPIVISVGHLILCLCLLKFIIKMNMIFLFKFVPNDQHPVGIDFKNDEFNIV